MSATAVEIQRITDIMYMFAGFREIETHDKAVLLENDLSGVHEFPSDITVRA
jgi:hypothetical protein